MKREHLGSITVTGTFALVLQFHRKSEQQSEQDQEDHEQQEQQQQKKPRLEELVAHIGLTSGGLAKRIELYGDYVVRQIGLSKESPVAKAVAEVAMGYLKGDKSPSDHSLDAILAFLSKACNRDMSDQQMLILNRELVKELDACMLSYFAFHWHHSAHLLDQVLSGERKLRSIVMAATRKHRFQRAMQALKAKRAFATLVETLKAMKQQQQEQEQQAEQQAEERRSSSGGRRSPVLLLVGGGMGAGKSTVVKQLLHDDVAAPIVQHDAVVVEADAFKETDVLYRALLSSGGSGDMTMASQMVHDDSTRAASSLLVSALNEGRDVVLDGTMSWEPFVTQTIAMARDVHRRRYRLGPGYLLGENGVLVERYWEPVDELVVPSSSPRPSPSSNSRPAYRIELVGVTCDALLAVMRGIRRAIITNRFVPIPAQLGSHKMFAASLERYCELVDGARIYSTSRMGGPPELIGWKEQNGELRVDPEAFKLIKELAEINPDAGSVLELYHDRPSNVWNEVALSPERAPRQEFVRNMLSGDGEYSSGSGWSPESSSSSSSTDSDSYNRNSNSNSSSMSLSLSSDSISSSSSSGSHLSLSSLEDSN